MDRMRQMLASIGQSLGVLSLAQKLLIAALMVIAIMTLMLWTVYAARPTMVPLPGYQPDQLAQARSLLAANKIPVEASGTQLMVPQDQVHLALGVLGQGGQLPDNTQLLFSNLAQNQHWMNSRADNDRAANIALMNELSRVLVHFSGVREARVFIDAPEPIGLGMAFRKPTATVTVRTIGGRGLDDKTVEAMAAVVAGAKAGLDMTSVRVVDATTGRQYKARGETDFSAADYMESVAKVEGRVQEKLSDALRYIPGVIVTANAQMDLRHTTTTSTKMLPVSPQGGSVSIVNRESTTNSVSGSASGPAEAGVRSNVAEDISRGGGGGAGSQTTNEKGETEFTVAVGKTQEQTVNARGMPTRINVTVNVPREYVAALARQIKAAAAPAGDAAEVTPAEIDQAFTAERDRLTKDLQPLVETMAQSDGGAAAPTTQAGTVTVSMIPVPFIAAGGGGEGMQAGLLGGGSGGDGGGLSGMLGSGLIKQVGVLGLAGAALMVMLLLVRKTSTPVVLPSAQEVVGLPPTLDAQSDLVGEADESQTAMMGIELDDSEIKTKKMLEQVQEMVKSKPQESAALMNRWLVTEN